MGKSLQKIQSLASAHAKKVANSPRSDAVEAGGSATGEFIEGLRTAINSPSEATTTGFDTKFTDSLASGAVAGSGLSLLFVAIREFYSRSKPIDNPHLKLMTESLKRKHGSAKPVVEAYFRSRSIKNVSASASRLGSKVLSAQTFVDVAAGILDVSAAWTSAKHSKRFGAQLKAFQRSDLDREDAGVKKFEELLMQLKSSKTGKAIWRGVDAASAVVPVAGPIGGAVAKGTSIASSALATVSAGKGVVDWYGQAKSDIEKSEQAAQLLHFLAYAEAMSAEMQGTFGDLKVKARGPASKAVHELFRKRGLSWVTGKYDVNTIILDKAGWMAIHDKMLLG